MSTWLSNIALKESASRESVCREDNSDMFSASSKIWQTSAPIEISTASVSAFRVEDEDTKGKKLQKHRIVILGTDGVGKTCLFLRYMYFDKSKGIQIKQTPGKDGHIFTKRIIGKQFVHEYEIWDFLSSDELE